MINISHSILLIAITVAVTIFLRAFPFLIFGGKRQMPERVKRVADVLPPAIIAILIVYCVKADVLSFGTSTIATLAALALVIAVHLWKRNTLLSVLLGTITYMILIRIL